MQQNEWSQGAASGYIFLMLFTDGVRIDLAFDPVEHTNLFIDDSLTVVLLDKDQLIPMRPAPTERSYFTKKPTQRVLTDPNAQPKQDRLSLAPLAGLLHHSYQNPWALAHGF